MLGLVRFRLLFEFVVEFWVVHGRIPARRYVDAMDQCINHDVRIVKTDLLVRGRVVGAPYLSLRLATRHNKEFVGKAVAARLTDCQGFIVAIVTAPVFVVGHFGFAE